VPPYPFAAEVLHQEHEQLTPPREPRCCFASPKHNPTTIAVCALETSLKRLLNHRQVASQDPASKAKVDPASKAVEVLQEEQSAVQPIESRQKMFTHPMQGSPAIHRR